MSRSLHKVDILRSLTAVVLWLAEDKFRRYDNLDNPAPRGLAHNLEVLERYCK